MLKHIFRTPFFWFLLLLLIAEFSAIFVNPYMAVPFAADVARNPTPLRGWPEYLLAKPNVNDLQNIAIISNSQGAGKEMGNPELLYTALLEKELISSGRNINVENWSVSGLRSDQIVLLSMVAAKRKLDLLVIITEVKSLDIADITRLGASSDDLDLIAGNVSLWPEILNDPLLKDTKWDQLLQRFLLLNSSLIRLRPYFLDILAEEIPSATHRFIFGHRRSQQALKSVNTEQNNAVESDPQAIQQARSRQDPKNYITVPAKTWQKQFKRNRLPTFHRLYPALQERLSASNTKLLWLWMPIYPGASTASLREGAAPVYSVICKEIEASGETCINLTNSLPAGAFSTLSASSHFNAEGHKAMSQLLRPVIEHALH